MVEEKNYQENNKTTSQSDEYNNLESKCDLSKIEEDEPKRSKTPKSDFFNEHGYARADHYR